MPSVEGANQHRGEIAVVLAGSPFVLSPSFEAIEAIDDQLGGIVGIARDGMADPGSLTLQQLAVIVTEGIRATGRARKTDDAHVGVKKIKRLIFEAGIPSVAGGVVQFLVAAVTGGAKPEGADAGND